jgi:hypothetical protein
VYGARLYGQQSVGIIQAFLHTVPALIVGGLCLVFGYMLGMKHFQNIWAVTAISFGTILVSEPLFDYFYIGQVPSFGAAIGFFFGIVGILATTLL